MKEISLRLHAELQDLEGDALLQRVIDVVNQKAQRIYWQQEALAPWVTSHFDDIIKTCKKPWSYAHLLHGYWATTAPQFTEGQTAVLNTEDMLCLFAHVRFALEQTSSKRKK
jgi:hypothetical protein